ncbi:MAG: hypothetical protein ABJZ55_05055 [Fuerstiella sp.]
MSVTARFDVSKFNLAVEATTRRVLGVQKLLPSLESPYWTGPFFELDRFVTNLTTEDGSPTHESLQALAQNGIRQTSLEAAIETYVENHPGIDLVRHACVPEERVAAALEELEDVRRLACFRPGMRFGDSLVGISMLLVDELTAAADSSFNQAFSLLAYLELIGIDEEYFWTLESSSQCGSILPLTRSIWRGFSVWRNAATTSEWFKAQLGEWSAYERLQAIIND